MDLNLLKSFVTVAEYGSFTQAAMQLKQPKSRVSRAVQRLETELGVHLLRRTTRQCQLTEAGQALFEQNQSLLLQIEQNLQAIAHSNCELTGSLKITAPEDFGQAVLSPLLPEFLQRYPEIRLELLLGNHYVDLIAQQIDLAFRIGELADASLIQRRLGQVSIILVATPAYLAAQGEPRSEAELSQHRLLRFVNDNPTARPVFASPFGPERAIQAAIESNHFSLLHQLALLHQGIATLPDFYARACLQAGSLQRVLPDWSGSPRNIQLLYAPTVQVPRRTRVFIDFIVAAMGSLLQPER